MNLRPPDDEVVMNFLNAELPVVVIVPGEGVAQNEPPAAQGPVAPELDMLNQMHTPHTRPYIFRR